MYPERRGSRTRTLHLSAVRGRDTRSGHEDHQLRCAPSGGWWVPERGDGDRGCIPKYLIFLGEWVRIYPLKTYNYYKWSPPQVDGQPWIARSDIYGYFKSTKVALIIWYTHELLGAYLMWSPVSLQILTKDSVTVTVDAVVYFRIQDAVSSVCNVDNVKTATRLLAQTTLRFIQLHICNMLTIILWYSSLKITLHALNCFKFPFLRIIYPL